MSTKFTLDEFIDNIEKNGFPQIRGAYFKVINMENNVHEGACALGQGIYNTFGSTKPPKSFLSWLQEPRSRNITIYDFTVVLNDHQNLEIPEIARKLRERFADNLSDVYEYSLDESVAEFI